MFNDICLQNDNHKLTVDSKSGVVKELYDVKSAAEENLVIPGNGYSFGKLFKTKNDRDDFLNLKLTDYSKDNFIEFSDKSHKIHEPDENFIKYKSFRYYLEIDFAVNSDGAERTGIELDFNFVNSPGSGNGKDRIIPTSPYLEPNSENGFYLMSRTSGRFVILVFSEPISCWRLKYSNFGHHILGFQILLKVLDLKFLNGSSLPAYKKSSVRISFAKDLEEAYSMISRIGGFPVVYSFSSGGIDKASIPIKVAGKIDHLSLIDPLKKEKNITRLLNNKGMINIKMDEPGIYNIFAESDRKSTGYTFFNAVNWREMILKVSDFAAEHFQLPEGCYARAIDSTSLKYRKLRVIGGYSFGNVFEEHSCGSGEFGGFLSWVGLKRMLHFGKTKKLLKSTERYFNSWALQRAAKKNRYFPNAVSPVEQKFLDFNFSPGHLYKEQLYIQHEGWFLEEFCDYFLLTGDRSILETVKLIAFHMIDEHQDKNGALINISSHNNGIFQKVDYTTCATPVIGLIKAGNLLGKEGFDKEGKVSLGAQKACDHLVSRGFVFPTETIPDVEFIDEGSIACTALTLIYAYLFLKDRDEYREAAGKILKYHDNWIIRTPGASLYGSSFRYWENTWETRDWGPSINGGHAWSIWTAEAKYYSFFIERNFTDLIDSFAAFISNMPKVNRDGSMYSNFTPDYITGSFKHNGFEFNPDYLAHDFPRKTFTASGSYFLIRASETWFYTSAVGFWNGELITLNATIEEGSKLVSHAPHFKKLVVEKGVGRIDLEHKGVLEIYKSAELKEIEVLKGEIIFNSLNKTLVKAANGRITIYT